MTGPISPVFEAIVHPPLGLMVREIIPGTFSGSGDLTRPAPVPFPFGNVNAFGLTWDFFTIPSGFGFTAGNPVVYTNRIIQLSAIHSGRDDHDLVSEYRSFSVEGVYWLWENPGPTRIHYEITPGCQIVFFWLLVKII